MSSQRKYKIDFAIYALRADPTTDRPAFYVKRKVFDHLLYLGDVESIGDHSGRWVSPIPPSEKCITKICMDVTALQSVRYGCCEICGFDKTFEYAHIIPARFGGPKLKHNLLILCPNHHTMFDRDLLQWAEMEKIWPKVAAALANTIDDKRLDSWRERLVERYSVSIPTARTIIENSTVRTFRESRC